GVARSGRVGGAAGALEGAGPGASGGPGRRPGGVGGGRRTGGSPARRRPARARVPGGRSGIGSGVTGRSRRAVCSNFANLTSVARLESVEGVMRSIFRIAVLVGVALTTPAQAQVKRAGDEEKPRIHRMEIYNNGVRTVRYFGSAGLSRGEDSVMRDLERAE